jgi:hypothetical protein
MPVSSVTTMGGLPTACSSRYVTPSGLVVPIAAIPANSRLTASAGRRAATGCSSLQGEGNHRDRSGRLLLIPGKARESVSLGNSPNSVEAAGSPLPESPPLRTSQSLCGPYDARSPTLVLVRLVFFVVSVHASQLRHSEPSSREPDDRKHLVVWRQVVVQHPVSLRHRIGSGRNVGVVADCGDWLVPDEEKTPLRRKVLSEVDSMVTTPAGGDQVDVN